MVNNLRSNIKNGQKKNTKKYSVHTFFKKIPAESELDFLPPEKKNCQKLKINKNEYINV